MSDNKPEKETWESKGKLFGKKAWELAKIAGAAIGKGLDQLEQMHKEGAALNNRSGTYESEKPYPQLFEEISKQLTRPLGKHRFRVVTDPNNCEIEATTRWEEHISNAQPRAQTELILTIRFVPAPEGTTVTYSWQACRDLLDAGLFEAQIVRLVNGWVKGICEGPPGPM